MWYNVNWDKLVLLLLPSFMRKPKIFGILKALISPVSSLHYKWFLNRDANLRKLSYNGQRCYLRKALNDECDNELRRIYIGDTENAAPKYIYTTAENLDIYLGTMYIDNEFNYSSGNTDFLVFAPQEVIDKKKNKLDALLNFYKLAGKKYQIVAI